MKRRFPGAGLLIIILSLVHVAGNISAQTVPTIMKSSAILTGNLSVPAGAFDTAGVLKQPGFPDPRPSCSTNYEMVPGIRNDIVSSPGPTFSRQPTETLIEQQKVAISFSTVKPCMSVIYYGLNSSYEDSLVDNQVSSFHQDTITNLYPSTLYHYKVSVKDSEGVNSTGDMVFATASPSSSTGVVRVYFNKSVDPSVAIWDTANVTDISLKLIDRIDSSKFSVDLALYSLSGSVGQRIVDALVAAKARGVKIRVIIENDNANTSAIANLKRNNIPLITDAFDSVNGGRGLMHNKFAVFDYRDTSSASDDWVWTGSWNATDPGNYNDAQDALEIQDKSIALAYTLEFNEMWGSDSDVPDQQKSRFGARKFDNTPHRFNVNGIPIELYFSPSDQTASHIKEELDRASSSINIAMLTFTRSDLA
ncbi:MAG: phospholipase D-like domain-containing protein, partial [Candidatus Kryptoniota bacterium]